MKKIVMATLLATLAGAASAQLSMSGKVSEWMDNTKTGAARSTQMVAEPTSNFAISFGEKLGNGMTARGTVETSLSGNTISGSDTRLGDRQGTVGLATNMFSVDVGRNVHSHFLAITTNDVFGTMYGSVAGDVHNFRGLRLGDAVFVSANLVKGWSLAFERTQTAGTEATVVAVSGKIAGVKADVAQFEQGKEKSTVFGLATKVAGMDVSYTHSDDTGAVKSKGDLFGVSKAFGAVTAKASYGKTNTDVKAYALGADYALSKRTEVGFAYRNVDRKGTTMDVAQVGVGVTHRF